jgi:hypothetical protein
MKKKDLLVVLPMSLILAACTIPTPAPKQPDSQAQAAQKISQIIEKGGSAFCRVSNLADNTVTEMTISGKKMKIAGSEMSEGKKGTMINDSVYIYSWEEGQKTGFKMKLPTEEEIKETAQAAPTVQPEVNIDEKASGYDDESKYKLDCAERRIADSEFAPPSDINFIDPSQMQNLNPQDLQKLFPQGDNE